MGKFRQESLEGMEKIRLKPGKKRKSLGKKVKIAGNRQKSGTFTLASDNR